MKWLSKKLLLKNTQIEKICREYFSIEIKIKQVLINNTNSSNGSFTSVFQDNHNDIYALCLCDKPLLLLDIKNIINKMSMKAEKYYPPNGDEGYFISFAKKLYESVFPNRKSSNNQEYMFYESYAPYSPALMRISQIKGEIKHYDTSCNQWKSLVDYNYYRVKVNE